LTEFFTCIISKIGRKDLADNLLLVMSRLYIEDWLSTSEVVCLESE
jgi:hypothetical protein